MMASDRLKNLQRTDQRYRRASMLKIPLSGTFELSPVCNFACRMCYVRKTAKEVALHERKLVELKDWIRIAEEAKKEGLLYLLLTGGEPLLWPDFWELYEKLIQMGFLISINTNGSMIDDVAIERLRKLPPYKMNITLYGASDETYEALCGVKNVFSKVDYAIQKLKEVGVNIKLNASLTPYNAQDLEKLINYAEEKKLILDVATYMFPPIRRAENMMGTNDRFTPEQSAKYRLKCYELQHGKNAYVNYLKKIEAGYIDPLSLEEACVDPLDGKVKCRAGSAAFWISWDGWLLPCGTMTEPKVDIMQGNFQSRWKEIVEISEKIILSGICSKCSNRTICHPCAAMAMAETGNTSGIPKYLCHTSKEMKRIASEELFFINDNTEEVANDEKS